MSISFAGRRDYLVRYSCLACAGSHHLRLSKKEFWSQQPLNLRCPEIAATVGYLGPEEEVRQIIANGRGRLDNIANDLGFDDFFQHPEIMLEVLGHLHFLAGNENLSCQCGSRQIEANVFPDKLELRCAACDSLLIIYAETPEDLAAVRRNPRIIMSRHGFASIDASKLRQEQ